jgi:hypothetical protein
MSHLDNATSELQQFQTKFSAWIDDAKRTGDLPAILKMFHLTREHYELADEVRKQLHASLEHVSRSLIPDVMAEKNVKTLTLADISRRFTVSTKISCSMLDKNAGHEWLKANGAEPLIQPTVNSSSLAAFAKDYLAASGKDLPAEIFKVSNMTYTSVTKS